MKKILIVDDEKNIREALREFLTAEGYQVALAENGKSGLEKFNQESFDVVFLDVKMPGIDGVEAFHNMKSKKPDIKYIIITGLLDESTFDRAMSISPGSVDAFLNKPFKPNDIRECLKTVFEGNKLPSFELNKKQMEALNKLGNACALNATVALSNMLKHEAKIAMQVIEIKPLNEMFNTYNNNNTYLCLTMGLTEAIIGKMAILFSWENGMGIADVFQERPVGTTKSYDEKVNGMVLAVGNILSGAYMNAITEQLKLPARASMPELVFGKGNTVFTGMIDELKAVEITGAEYFFAIHTKVALINANVDCEVLLIPHIDSLKKILQILGAIL